MADDLVVQETRVFEKLKQFNKFFNIYKLYVTMHWLCCNFRVEAQCYQVE